MRMKRENDILTSAHQTAWARIVRASTRILEEVELALKTAGFPPLSWYDLLLELKRAYPDGLRPFQLEKKMLLPQYNVSRLIDRVEKAGYVERLSFEEDGRGQIVKITVAGKNLQKKMWPVYKAVLEREIARHINEQEAETLSALLASLARRAD